MTAQEEGDFCFGKARQAPSNLAACQWAPIDLCSASGANVVGALVSLVISRGVRSRRKTVSFSKIQKSNQMFCKIEFFYIKSGL